MPTASRAKLIRLAKTGGLLICNKSKQKRGQPLHHDFNVLDKTYSFFIVRSSESSSSAAKWGFLDGVFSSSKSRFLLSGVALAFDFAVLLAFGVRGIFCVFVVLGDAVDAPPSVALRLSFCRCWLWEN